MNIMNKTLRKRLDDGHSYSKLSEIFGVIKQELIVSITDDDSRLVQLVSDVVILL